MTSQPRIWMYMSSVQPSSVTTRNRESTEIGSEPKCTGSFAEKRNVAATPYA